MTAHQLEQALVDHSTIIDKIVAVLRPDVPAGFRWQATVGPYDLGAVVGHGRTREDAVNDLLMGLDRP